MTASNGYTLDQLLEWSVDDDLIDGYERHEDRMTLIVGDKRQELPFDEARTYLKSQFGPRGKEDRSPSE